MLIRKNNARKPWAFKSYIPNKLEGPNGKGQKNFAVIKGHLEPFLLMMGIQVHSATEEIVVVKVFELSPQGF